MLTGNNIKVDSEAKAVVITVQSSFYPSEAIDMAADELSDICETEFDDDDGTITIRLKPKDGAPVEELGYEFLNHALACVKELGGQ